MTKGGGGGVLGGINWNAHPTNLFVKKKKKTFRLIFCRKVKKKERMDNQNIPGEWYCSMFLNLASRKKKKNRPTTDSLTQDD